MSNLIPKNRSRKKMVKNDLKVFYKLMNNPVYGKAMTQIEK